MVLCSRMYRRDVVGDGLGLRENRKEDYAVHNEHWYTLDMNAVDFISGSWFAERVAKNHILGTLKVHHG